VIAGEPGSRPVAELLSAVRRTFLPERVVAFAGPGMDADLVPLTAGKSAPSGGALAFVCRNYTCGLPAASAQELRAQLQTH
jgi:uncharacterized protein YyaL (SSP411 family)